MDQPTQDVETKIGYLLALIGAIFGGWTKYTEWRAKRGRVDTEKIKARASIEDIYVGGTEKLTDYYKQEADKAREEAETERNSGLDWMQRALEAEARIKYLEREITSLKNR